LPKICKVVQRCYNLQKARLLTIDHGIKSDRNDQASVTLALAGATPQRDHHGLTSEQRARPSHAIFSLKGRPRECRCSMKGDEVIHIVFRDTVDVESIPVSTEGINDIVGVAV